MQTAALLCNLPAPHFWIFSDIVPTMVYYSHLPILVISVILGYFVYSNGRTYLANNVLFVTLLAFATWLGLDAVLWASNRPDVIMFAWSALLFFEPAVYAGSLYLVYVLLEKKDVPRKGKWMFFAAFLPIFVLMPTAFNLSGFDLGNCLGVEGFMPLDYAYGLEILSSIWIIVLSIRRYTRTKDVTERRFILSLSVGISLFLILFASGNIIGSITTDWNLAQFGLFGMPILATALMYLIVKHKAFNVKMLGSQALVYGMLVLTGAQFVFDQTPVARILSSVTFVSMLVFGWLLIRNVRKEEEKERLENMTQALYKQNVEMTVKNKTLSLLKNLYQISILSLAPQPLAEKLSDTVRNDLNLEMAGVLVFDKKTDSLTPLHFSKSERLVTLLSELKFHFREVTIDSISTRQFFKDSMYGEVASMTNDLNSVWGGLIEKNQLEKIKAESHIKTTILFPLMIENEPIGAFLLALNRDYESLNPFEKDSLKSLIDVVSVALDRSNLYKEVQDANEKLQSLDKLKTEFLSLASHQLRSPLTAIKGYSSMLLEGDYGEINPKATEAIDRVFQSSKNLTIIVEDLLNVSKIEQGGMKYEMAPFDFAEIARDMAKDLSVTAEKKGLSLAYEGDTHSKCTVNGDKEKLRQVVLNFIDNSMKYTKEGSIKVSVKCADGKVRFAVTDTGMGIPAEILPTLFQKFNRGDGARMNTTGSGLGLYLAKQIVEAHKGRVWAESAGAGKGSTFYLEMAAI